MSNDPLSIKGIILKSTEYKEKDRMVTILTADNGIMSFVAKGVAGKAGKNSYVAVPYMLCDFVLTPSHGFYYLKDGLIIAGNSGIMNSLEAMAVAGHIADCVIDSVFQSDNSRAVYELVVYAYYALATRPESHIVVYTSFNWKLLQILGLSLRYELCNSCGKPIGTSDIYHLSFSEGSCFCDECSKRNGYGGFLIGTNGINLLNFIFEHDSDRIFTIKADVDTVDMVRRFSTTYLGHQFDREIKDPINALRLPL